MCSDIFSPGEGDPFPENPVVIELEERPEEVFDRFLAEYNAEDLNYNMHTNWQASFLRSLYFNENHPVVISETLSPENKNHVIQKVLQFYKKWENLFTCPVENLRLVSLLKKGGDLRVISPAIRGFESPPGYQFLTS